MRAPLLAVTICAVSACSAPKDDVQSAPPPMREIESGSQQLCDAGALQSWIDSTATQDLGAHLLRESGAKQLQWIPPRSQVTADYRRDRLRVSYDDEMAINRIVCQ